MMTLRKLAARPPSIPIVAADYLAALAESRGRQELHAAGPSRELTILREHALIESAVSSNRIEGVEVERSRVATLVFGKPRLRDRPEEEIRGYREALNLIHQRREKLPLNESSIFRLHRLVRGEIGDAGKYKERARPIVETHPDGRSRERFMPLAAEKCRAAIMESAALWRESLDEGWGPPPVAMAAFNLDFLCIHPFRDGNGRVSRLLLLQQCYQLGFEVGAYISLERIIEQNKERYYETLETSSRGWHEGKHDPWPYINFVLFLLKSAYREFEERARSVRIPKGAKTERILGAIGRQTSEFSVAQLERALPGVSREMIRRVLRDLSRKGEVRCSGRGPGARWRRKGITLKKG